MAKFVGPRWMDSPAVFAVLLPEEDADDLERATRWMVKSGYPPGRYEKVGPGDVRYPEAVAAVVGSFVARPKEAPPFLLLDKERGLFRFDLGRRDPARPHLVSIGKVQDRLLRVMILRAAAPLAAP